jgi:hypothetical protein
MTGPPLDESVRSVNNNTITACVYHQKEDPSGSADMQKDGLWKWFYYPGRCYNQFVHVDLRNKLAKEI